LVALSITQLRDVGSCGAVFTGELVFYRSIAAKGPTGARGCWRAL